MAVKKNKNKNKKRADFLHQFQLRNTKTDNIKLMIGKKIAITISYLCEMFINMLIK